MWCELIIAGFAKGGNLFRTNQSSHRQTQGGKTNLFSGLKVTFKIIPKNLILNLKKKIQKKKITNFTKKKCLGF